VVNGLGKQFFANLEEAVFCHTKKVHKFSLALQQKAFYKCPETAMDLERDNRNRANQSDFHNGANGAGPRNH
jgi:hypothetical protein